MWYDQKFTAVHNKLDRVLVNQQTILKNQDTILANQGKIMAQIDDLNAQISTLQGTETTLAAEVATAITDLEAIQSSNPVDLSGPIATLTSINQALATVSSSLGAAETPASTPPASTGSTGSTT